MRPEPSVDLRSELAAARLDAIDLSGVARTRYYDYMQKPSGREHYKLLAYLAGRLPDGAVVADLGTLYGCSALALATNPRIRVVTYDITDHGAGPFPDNVRPVLKNALECVDDIARSQLIVLDIDPHDGKQEREFLDALAATEFEGLVVCDDIHLNDAMQRWWDAVDRPKADVTEFGHWSGTGVIFF